MCLVGFPRSVSVKHRLARGGLGKVVRPAGAVNRGGLGAFVVGAPGLGVTTMFEGIETRGSADGLGARVAPGLGVVKLPGEGVSGTVSREIPGPAGWTGTGPPVC
jgi:hypothetical protein